MSEDLVPLRRIFAIGNGGTPPSGEEYWDGNIAWATPVDLARVDGKLIDQTERTLTPEGLAQAGRLVPAGSLVLSTRAPIGYIAEAARPMSLNQGCRALVADRRMIDQRFFRFQLLARRDDLRALGNGSTFQELSTEALASYAVVYAPLDEQRRIADFLDAETARIDALIAAKQQMITTLQVHMAEGARATLLGAIDPTNRGTADGSAKLKRAFALQRGHDLPSDQRVDGSIPVISSGGPSGFHNVAAARPPGVITGRYGTVGEVFFSDVPYWPLNTTLYVTDFFGNDPRWAFWLLRSLPLEAESEKSAVGGINRNVIGELRIKIPRIETQRAIARELDAEQARLDALTSTLTRQIELLKERRQALITAAVSGELDL